MLPCFSNWNSRNNRTMGIEKDLSVYLVPEVQVVIFTVKRDILSASEGSGNIDDGQDGATDGDY